MRNSINMNSKVINENSLKEPKNASKTLFIKHGNVLAALHKPKDNIM